MDLMQTVEDSFAFLELLGMKKTERGVHTDYRFPAPIRADTADPLPVPGQGWISVLGDIGSYYFTRSEYQVKTEFYQKYRIEEHFIEFSRMDTAEGFYTIDEGDREKQTAPTGIALYMNRPTGAASWMYCPADTCCRGHSLIIREQAYLKNLLPSVQARYGTNADPFPVIHRAAQACLPLYQSVLDDLTNCRYVGTPAQMLLDAKVMEIEAAWIHRIENALYNDLMPFSDYERQAIAKAQEILRNELIYPPSMKDLARRIGLNPNKMQAAFRQTAGVTAGEYLRSYRMEKALEYLACDMLLEDVARRVGYRSATRFSEAFRKSYGVLPSFYRKITR